MGFRRDNATSANSMNPFIMWQQHAKAPQASYLTKKEREVFGFGLDVGLKSIGPVMQSDLPPITT